MDADGELWADGDVTMLGGQPGQALPFDPRAALPLARQQTSAIPLLAALPFADANRAAPLAPPPPEPVRISVSPAWVGMHPDPSRKDDRPATPLLPSRPAAELEEAAREGAAAASTAALPPLVERPNPSRARLLADDPPSAPRELVDVLYAPKGVAADLRRASTKGCCGDRHASSSTSSSQDPRLAAQHAMSHAGPRSADELFSALTSAFRQGASPPVVAISGALSLALDEIASFKATLALATAFLRSDPLHAELLAQADRLDTVSGDLPEDTLVFMRGRLEEALRRMTKNAQLEMSRDRSLLEKRRLAACDVLGGRRLRASLRSGTGRDISCYLPPEVASYLPLGRSFQALLVATVHLAPEGAGQVCLDVLSLGRPALEGPPSESVARARRTGA